jgi:D-alanyl-lipoteichoic acid acyltransferase DltB (MBOAT superfamily)
MLFPTIDFAIFFGVVFVGNWLLSRSPIKWKIFILAASYIFYAWYDWRFIFLLAASTLINAAAGRRISLSESRQTRRHLLVVAIVADLGMLGFFKYFDFGAATVDNLIRDVGIHGAPVALVNITVPVGISFFTFMAISYVVDIYHRKLEPSSLIDFAVYLSFFPHLLSGPIVRGSELLPQIGRSERRNPREIDFPQAAILIFGGLFKKVVISSYVSTAIVQPVFNSPSARSAPEILLAAYGYAVQIYCDFSGYTDIAIGCALLLGFRFPQNFDAPYTARSIQDFWRRWHITLSFWLRDYLYIPLGGNRKGNGRTYINLMLTMLLGGLWHGASWNFVLWGGLHGCALGVHKLYRTTVGDGGRRLPLGVGWATTVVFVVLCWIPFRARHLGDTAEFLRGMFTLRGGTAFQADAVFIALALVVPAHLIGLWLASAVRNEQPLLRRLLRALNAQLSSDPISSWYVRLGTGTVLGSFLVTLWVLLVLLSAETHTRPFIYFQF